MKRYLLPIFVVVAIAFAWSLQGPKPEKAPVTPETKPKPVVKNVAPAGAPTVKAAPPVSPPSKNTSAPVADAAKNPHSKGNSTSAPVPPGIPGQGQTAPPPIAVGGPSARRRVPTPSLPTFPWPERESKLGAKLNEKDLGDALNGVKVPNAQPYVVGGLPFTFPGPGSGATGSRGTFGGTGGIGGSIGTSSGGTSSGIGGHSGSVAGFPPTAATSGPPPSAPSSPPPAQPDPSVTLNALFGKWEGVVRPDSGDRNYQLSISLSGKVEEGKLRGDVAVELSRDGVLVARNAQSGELSVIRQGPQGSTAIWLQPGDPYYYQLYYRKASDDFIGIIYQRMDASEVPPVGKIELHRKS